MRLAIDRRKLVLIGSALLIFLIALADWRSADNIPLGFLYLVPMLMLGRILKPWQTVVTAALCTLLAELYDPFTWDIRTGMPRDTLYFAAFVTVGIFVYTAHRNNQITLAHLHEIELQRNARQEAEEQLKILIESSPAAILTANTAGEILTANDAAHRILTLPANTLTTLNLQQFFPALANIARTAASDQVFRAVMQSRGYRADGETFLAEICFSTYRTNSGARLAALILDASEELRTREESSLHQMLAGSRIAVAAVSHEIRNVCGAISVVHQNLLRSQLLGENKDFEALGNLVVALEKIASVDLLQYPDEKLRGRPPLRSRRPQDRHHPRAHSKTNPRQPGISIPPSPPSGPTAPTSCRSSSTSPPTASAPYKPASRPRMLTIAARRTGNLVAVELIDNAGGVPHPEELFRPFQPGAHATGLGLYLSRAFARSFRRRAPLHRSIPGHASFTVTLPIASNPEEQLLVTQTILLIDDHTLLRESLVRFLAEEPSLVVAGHCATIPEARAILKEKLPSISSCSTTISVPNPAPIFSTSCALTANPARVLMLTAGMNPSARLPRSTTRRRRHRSQADRYPRSPRRNPHRRRNGGAWWPPETLSPTVLRKGPEPRTLTERQRLVLRAILDGLSNKEIAARLEVSETAIKASIQELFAKAGVRTRSQLVRAALERYPHHLAPLNWQPADQPRDIALSPLVPTPYIPTPSSVE